MTSTDYPFDEYLKNFDDVQAFLENEQKEGRAPDVPDGESHPFVWTTIKTSIVMKKKYPVFKQCFHRMTAVSQVFGYVSRHFSEFDTGDFAVYGSDKVGGLVGVHLLRAIHQAYTANPPPEKEPLPEEIMAIARTFQQ